MLFHFDVTLTDVDYLELNKFHSIRSPFGVKQMRGVRSFLYILHVILVIIALLSNGFTLSFCYHFIIYTAILAVAVMLIKPFMNFSIKMQVKAIKEGGKLPYTKKSTIDFYDGYLIDTTPEEVTKQNYSLIERTAVVEGKAVYVYVSNLSAHIIPYTSFESKEQLDSFIEFIKTVNPEVNYYK